MMATMIRARGKMCSTSWRNAARTSTSCDVVPPTRVVAPATAVELADVRTGPATLLIAVMEYGSLVRSTSMSACPLLVV